MLECSCAYYTNFEVGGNIKNIFIDIFSFSSQVYYRMTFCDLHYCILFVHNFFSKSYKQQFLWCCLVLVYQRDMPYNLFIFKSSFFSLKKYCFVKKWFTFHLHPRFIWSDSCFIPGVYAPSTAQYILSVSFDYARPLQMTLSMNFIRL